MSQKKRRKRAGGPAAGRKTGQERLADERGGGRKRLDPAARALLYGDLVFLAAVSLLYANELISELVSGMCTLIGVVLLLLALRIQFGPGNGRGGMGSGPRR